MDVLLGPGQFTGYAALSVNVIHDIAGVLFEGHYSIQCYPCRIKSTPLLADARTHAHTCARTPTRAHARPLTRLQNC